MPTRTTTYTKLPWTGGLNDSVDPGLLPDSDLVTADNIVFSTSGARIKRQNHEYFDAASDPPVVTHRSSSGTTRTLVFASSLKPTSPNTIHKLVAGESITISNSNGTVNTNYGGTFLIASIGTTNVANDTLTYTAGSSLNESSTSDANFTIERADPYIHVHDFWYYNTSSGNMTQELIAVQKVTTDPNFGFNFYKFDTNGRRVQILPATPATDDDFSDFDCDRVMAVVINESLIISFNGLGVKPRRYNPNSAATYALLGGTPPDVFAMEVHQNRVWALEKGTGRAHYSDIGDPTVWNGVGDSGAIDVGIGVGDPEGNVGLKSFKGRLFVGKKGQLYQVVGDAPENFSPLLITSGLGFASAMALPTVDQDDVMFLSNKGFHSLSATDSYGDFTGSFLSKKIQNTFNTFESGFLKYIQGVYISELNSCAFNVTEDGQDAPNALWFFNVENKEWYRWPNVDARGICVRQEEDRKRLFWGTSDSRIVRSQAGGYTDFTSSAIGYRIKTGTIYPDSNPNGVKFFKRVGFYFRPTGDFSFTATIKVDNLPPQALTFSQDSQGAMLGEDFTLGQSVLAFDNILAPFSQQIQGVGRGCTIEVTQNGLNEQVELYGFFIEFESAETAQEVVGSDDL